MKWIITEDRVNGAEEQPMAGPNWQTRMVPVAKVGKGLEVGHSPTEKINTDARVAEYASELPTAFQLQDDDGEVYFEGRCADLGLYDADEAFEPLDRFESYGCTTMMYRPANDPTALWEQL